MMMGKELDDLLKDIDEVDEQDKQGSKRPSRNYYIEEKVIKKPEVKQNNLVGQGRQSKQSSVASLPKEIRQSQLIGLNSQNHPNKQTNNNNQLTTQNNFNLSNNYNSQNNHNSQGKQTSYAFQGNAPGTSSQFQSTNSNAQGFYANQLLSNGNNNNHYGFYGNQVLSNNNVNAINGNTNHGFYGNQVLSNNNTNNHQGLYGSALNQGLTLNNYSSQNNHVKSNNQGGQNKPQQNQQNEQQKKQNANKQLPVQNQNSFLLSKTLQLNDLLKELDQLNESSILQPDRRALMNPQQLENLNNSIKYSKKYDIPFELSEHRRSILNAPSNKDFLLDLEKSLFFQHQSIAQNQNYIQNDPNYENMNHMLNLGGTIKFDKNLNLRDDDYDIDQLINDMNMGEKVDPPKNLQNVQRNFPTLENQNTHNFFEDTKNYDDFLAKNNLDDTNINTSSILGKYIR